jgi:hypothetical protein
VSERKGGSKEQALAGDKEYALKHVAENAATVAHQLENLCRSDASLYDRSLEERERITDGWWRQLSLAEDLLAKYEDEARAYGATDAEVARAKRQ